jgi:hypothetical protein
MGAPPMSVNGFPPQGMMQYMPGNPQMGQMGQGMVGPPGGHTMSPGMSHPAAAGTNPQLQVGSGLLSRTTRLLKPRNYRLSMLSRITDIISACSRECKTWENPPAIQALLRPLIQLSTRVGSCSHKASFLGAGAWRRTISRWAG